jgi:uncharacterized repeat protein (TIGR01451 family)
LKQFFAKRSCPRPRALALALLLALSASVVHAGGTPSGTVISNTATLTFSVTGVVQPTVGSSPTGNSSGAGTATTFVVDKKVNLTVTTTDSSFVSVAPGSTAQVLTFSVTNTGNDVQDFALSSSQRANGTTLFGGTDNFDATACSQFVESGATAGYQAAQDTATYIDELAADASKTVYVVCSIPATQVNGDVAVVTLQAQARIGGTAGSLGGTLTATSGANTAGVDIVFADGAGSDDAANDALYSSRDAYKVLSSVLTVTKTVSLVCDPVDGTTNPKNIPGAIVRYAVTVANAGSAAASGILTTVQDVLNANLTFDANQVTGAGGAAGCSSASGTPLSGAGKGFELSLTGTTRPGTYPKFFTTAADSDGMDLSGSTITANFATAMPVEGSYAAGELKPGESVILNYQVVIQ